MLTWLKIGVGALAGASLAFAAGYLVGRSDGRESVLAGLKDDRITILQDGMAVDKKVIGAEDGQLCQFLGGCEP